ncbi:MAG: tetratricopeptide repeat protein [bacterium]
MKQNHPLSLRLLVVLVTTLRTAFPCAGADPLTTDEAAAVLLDSANRAFNEQKHDFAIERFKEFAKLYNNHRDLARAEYGLGLALIESPRKDCTNAAQAFQSASSRGDFADRPFVLYYLGAARRAIAEQELAAIKSSAETDPRRATANQRLTEAVGSFSEAANAFLARAGTPGPAADRPTDLDWAARARCDSTDLLLRLGRFKEAAEAADAFLRDTGLTRTPYRELAIYHQGYARFELKEYPAAGRALSQLTPFEQTFGLHARYLLGRIHHLADERAEAAIQYRAVNTDYARRKAAAQTAMQNPNALTLEKRQLCEALLRDPTPEYLSRAAFYLALTACESDRFSEALDGFTTFIQQNPSSPYLADAQLRQGFCRLQMGSCAEAIPVLQALTNQPPRADRALWWLARCQIKLADPRTPATYGPAMTIATNHLRRAADLAGQLAQTDPDAKVRRGEILMDLADTLITLQQYKEAADTYQRVLQENTTPTRMEEALQRRVTALHLGGYYRESDELGTQFEQAYPRSLLLPAVLFRRAENAYLVATALATATNSATPNRTQELPRLLGEAIARYQRLLDRYPDSTYANLARDAAATCYYRLGKFKDAADLLAAIPADAYSGDLANVPCLLADCLMRRVAQNPADAVAASDLLSKAEQAAKLLDGFLAANEKSPQVADALLKQGWCYSRIAETARAPEERKKAHTNGRAAYERLLQQFPKDTAAAVAVFERASCMAALGEVPAAISELNRFTQDPLRGTATAPLALTRLAALLRTQNRGAEAITALQQYRAQFEISLLKDPAQTDTVPPLQYEQAMALKQTGKTAEARALFESVMKQFPEHPAAANAAWRAAQSRREELAAQMDAARQAAARSGVKPEELAAVQRSLSDAMNGLRDAVSALQTRTDALGKIAPGSPAHLAALYEIAWSCRALADVEIETAMRQLRQEAVARIRAKLAQQMPAGQAPAAIREPEIPLSQVAPPLSERTAIEYYERLVKAASDAPLAAQARLELGELYASRSQYKPAALVLGAALTGQPSPEILPQIRVRLAAVLLGLQEPKAALAQAEVVAADTTSPLAGYARYLMGEAYFQQQEWKRVMERLVPFRDQGTLQNMPDVSDRALLRLGQAYLKTAQPDLCRQTLALLAQRFSRSAWLDEALYTTGLSLQKQEQYDPAIEAFRQVTGRTASAWGAQAQLQIGLCRMSQKRPAEALQALLAVPLTYDYPEWQAPAYVEAARACQELKQTDEAVRLLQKVTQQYAESPWAQTARDQLNTIEKAR